MKKFIQRSLEEDDQRLDEEYGYIERRITDELDSNGGAQEHRDETFQLMLLEGHRLQRLIGNKGKPLSAEDQSNEADREKQFVNGEWKDEAEKEKKQRADNRLKLDEQFMSHFKFDVVGSEELNGRLSYIVTIVPKARSIPVRSSREKLFTHMQGKVWVDTYDYSLVKCDLHLTETIYFYGFLGSLHQLDVLIQRRFVATKVWMPERVAFSVDGRKLLTTTRMKQDSVYSDFRKLGN